jgi:hypothetical protein
MRHLFARSVSDVVNEATKPLMNKQGKLYGALLRDWGQIVGAERARVTRPERLQFPTTEAAGATLHINARPSAAPELTYAHEQILEQCARYFGYRAITRLVIHATHAGFEDTATEEIQSTPPATKTRPAAPLPTNVPAEMRGVLERLSRHLASPSDKK